MMNMLTNLIIGLQVVCDLLREMVFVLLSPVSALPRTFRLRRENGGSLGRAWKCAMEQRWRERQVAEDFKHGIHPQDVPGSFGFWQHWADLYGVNLNIDDIERIIRENPGHDELGDIAIAHYVVPLQQYAEREWRRQRPWHFRWVKTKQEVTLKLKLI